MSIDKKMFAVVRTGGKQFKIEEGSILDVEKLDGAPGDTIDLESVLLVADGEKIQIGQPIVNGAKVQAEIVSQGLDKKKYTFKKRRRQSSKQRIGHRQRLTKIKIASISV